MLNTTNLLIDALVRELERSYASSYGLLEPEYPRIAAWAARMSLENIANTDAPYHDVEHTVMVCQVGQEILRGLHLVHGGVSPRDWLHFTVSLLCHDIGYVRGVCLADQGRRFVTGVGDETVELPDGATDAALTPYHVDRGKQFVHDRFGGHPIIDAKEVARNIGHTRFPVPADDDHAATGDYPGLVRAADLIGQMADPRYLRKLAALFSEFQETGTADVLGYRNPDDLRRAYPKFFWETVRPYLDEALQHLRRTQDGQQWISNLYAHVFFMENQGL